MKIIAQPKFHFGLQLITPSKVYKPNEERVDLLRRSSLPLHVLHGLHEVCRSGIPDEQPGCRVSWAFVVAGLVFACPGVS